MMDKITIQLNYTRAINQSRKIYDLAAQLRKIANSELQSAMNNLSHDWNGESASAFLKKAQKANEDLLKNAQQLTSTASAIRKCAENIRNSELKALEIINQKSC